MVGAMTSWGHLLCNHYLYTCSSSNLPFCLGERGPGTNNRGRDALDTLPGHWAVGAGLGGVSVGTLPQGMAGLLRPF